MADTKISALTAVVTPAGTDTLACVQGGVTKKLTVTQVLAAGDSPITASDFIGTIGATTPAAGAFTTVTASTSLIASGIIRGFGGTVDSAAFQPGTDANTGLYWVGADSCGITCGGVLAVNWSETTGVITSAFTDNVGVGGTLAVTGGFGCNAAAVQTAYASGGALNSYTTGAYGLNSDANMSALHAMVVAIRAALVANGIMS